jgi:hypothetical protein
MRYRIERLVISLKRHRAMMEWNYHSPIIPTGEVEMSGDIPPVEGADIYRGVFRHGNRCAERLDRGDSGGWLKNPNEILVMSASCASALTPRHLELNRPRLRLSAGRIKHDIRRSVRRE